MNTLDRDRRSGNDCWYLLESTHCILSGVLESGLLPFNFFTNDPKFLHSNKVIDNIPALCYSFQAHAGRNSR